MPSAYRVEAIFFTATILEWKHLLKPAKYKDVIVNSLSFLVREQRVYVHGFVIMNNHIHTVWQLREGHTQQKVQQSFLKYTAQQIKFDLIANHPAVLEHVRVDAGDSVYQFGERNPLSVELWSEAVLLQKLNYVHQNPVRAGLCADASDSLFFALFYVKGADYFGFLTRYERYY